MRRLAPIACVLVLACRPASLMPLDTTLPDGEPLAAVAPRVTLQQLAEDTNPDTRALALTGLARAPATPEVRAAWVQRGLYDPDPWVQRAMIDVGLDDATLDAFVVQPSADATTRATVALDRMSRGARYPVDAFPVGAATARPDRVPLGLVRVALGDASAKAVVESAIDAGDLPDDALLLAAFAVHGGQALSAVLERGERWAEPDAIARIQLVRGLLGDPAARVAWRGAVRADPSVAWDLLDVIEALPADDRAAVARDVSPAGDKALRDALAVVASPSPTTVRHAIESDDPTTRELGMQRVALLGDGDAEELLRRVLRSDDPWTWVSASRAVSVHHLCALQDTFTNRLLDDRSQVRAAAAAVVALCEAGASP